MLKLPDISEICYIIQRLNSYNSLTINLAGKVYWTIYRPDNKSYRSSEMLETNFPFKGQYLKSSNINLASVSEHVGKTLWNLLKWI